MIYLACKKLIEKGVDTIEKKEEMQNKLDLYLLGNRITETQYTELVELMG